MKTPIKEQIELLAIELFKADFGLSMTEDDWNWRSDKIRNYYRFMAGEAIREWEKIRRKL